MKTEKIQFKNRLTNLGLKLKTNTMAFISGFLLLNFLFAMIIWLFKYFKWLFHLLYISVIMISCNKSKDWTCNIKSTYNGTTVEHEYILKDHTKEEMELWVEQGTTTGIIETTVECK
jgi:hypothetical protein